ncbi:MAG: bifunctional phosphoribosyl-AMP cyclohydrolase/phosphoribosyl-ATP diphosphatase HisIE [Flammeovirgaceae bacterium]|nr:MAG: bifunctional phosphoribosyl-AMP cyclohydrolase/phosphoribosyl-ATP diphosphatase HisIE [Flammeovirgaceae bacterium]
MKPDFSKNNGLLPCIIQDYRTQKVLTLGYMNEEAWLKTQAEQRVTFFSRSKNRLWTKGETSGNFLYVVDMLPDCDKDTLLIKVKPAGPVCHTGTDTCFGETNNVFSLATLEEVIRFRKEKPEGASYTSALFQAGINKIAQKVGEEAVELVIEAKDYNDEGFLNEAADLLYHYLVLLAARNKTLADVEQVLKDRHR